MLQALLHLIDVQRIDVKIDALDKQRAALPQKLNELERKHGEEKSALSIIDFQITEKEKERRMLDNNQVLDGTKLKKWEARLNEIKNQREFLALSREIEGQKKANNDTHEKIHTLATEVRTLQVRLETHRDDIAVMEVDIDTERADVAAKMGEVDKTIEQHKKERAEFLAEIPPPVLKRYDTIRTRRQGALAPVANGRCTACNIGLPPQLYNTVLRGQTIEQCPSCQRIVYYREPSTDAPAAQ